MRFSTSGFFHESVSPKPMSIQLGPFRIFLKIRGDIRSSRCNTGDVDTGGKWKKSSIIKILIICIGHLWVVELAHKQIFFFKFILRSQQPDIVPIFCNRCHWHRWQMCHRCRWYWWQIATGVIDTDGKFAAGIVHGGKFSTRINNTSETGGKFANGVVDTGGAHWLANISANFRKNLKRSYWDTLGLGVNWFMKKPEAKNLVTLSH